MQQQGIKITKFLLHETGSYNPQFRRPYEVAVTGTAFNIVKERLAGSNSYVAGAMGGISTDFIRPSIETEKQLNIDNGWDSRRLRFMLELEYNWYTGGAVKEIVMGYTNHNGIGLSGSIDPNMTFIINSVMQVRTNIEMTPLGNQTHASVFDSSHILADNNWGGVYSNVGDERMRPEDVYSTMSRSQLKGLAGTLRDTRQANSTIPVKSRRANSSPANYMAQVLQGYREANSAADLGQTDVALLDQARSNTQENLVAKDPFMSAIAECRGQGPSNTFSFNDLQLIDPNIQYVTKATLMGNVELAASHRQGQTEYWHGSNSETLAATVLSQAVPGLLMELALTRAYFRSTNDTIGGHITTTVANVDGFSNANQEGPTQRFIYRLEHEVLADISNGGQTNFALEMDVDLLGETRIQISLNSGPLIPFVVPSFCDAIMVPVLTAQPKIITDLAEGFEQLSIALGDASSENHNHPGIMSSGGTTFGVI
jgi:hypothetical protein